MLVQPPKQGPEFCKSYMSRLLANPRGWEGESGLLSPCFAAARLDVKGKEFRNQVCKIRCGLRPAARDKNREKRIPIMMLIAIITITNVVVITVFIVRAACPCIAFLWG